MGKYTLSAVQVVEMRTCSEFNKPVYFNFDGTLFLYDGERTEPLTTFRGFNCAMRKSATVVDSYEYVEFDPCDFEILPIFNKQVKFEMGQLEATVRERGTVVSIPIAVNRDDYTALEHFTFIANNDFWPDDVSLAWTRECEPRVLSMKGDRWRYCGAGYKSYVAPVSTFPHFNFDVWNRTLADR